MIDDLLADPPGPGRAEARHGAILIGEGGERLATVTLPIGARWAGKPLSDLALHAVGVRVMSVRRNDGKAVAVSEELRLLGGDTLVLSGQAEPLARAEEKLLAG